MGELQETFEFIGGDSPMGEVILITRHATAESAVEEMRHETFGFLMKPYLAEGLRGYEKKHKAKGSFYL